MARTQKDDPSDNAEKLLVEFEVKVLPTPVERIAKQLGAQVRFSPLDQELSGMIFIKNEIPIIGVNSLHHPNRQRFTIAHEIGHLRLHRQEITSAVHVDKEFPVLMRDSKSAQGVDLMEIQANQFAAALLMPKVLLEPLLLDKKVDIDNDEPLEELAKKLRVSKQALEYRIRNLV
jgi:Zn-dependent peptidase ImmA (M78 family)